MAEPQEINDIDFRLITTKLLAIMGIIILTPITIIDVFNGELLLAFMISVFIAVLILVAVVLHKSPAHFKTVQWLVPLLMLGTLAYVSSRLGIMGSYWVFPAIIVLYFMTPMKQALLINTVLITAASIVAFKEIEHAIAFRFIGSMVSVAVFVTIFMYVIDRQRKELEYIAITDTLTGLLNRTTLRDSLNTAIEQYRRTGIPMSLIAIDLDHFKEINDQYGHDAGDQVLKTFSRILRQQSRMTDKIFREGGEEFLILLFDAHKQAAVKHAERIRDALVDYDGRMPTASFGVAEYNDKESFDEWIKRADNNLYTAKKSGRDRVVSDAM